MYDVCCMIRIKKIGNKIEKSKTFLTFPLNIKLICIR